MFYPVIARLPAIRQLFLFKGLQSMAMNHLRTSINVTFNFF